MKAGSALLALAMVTGGCFGNDAPPVAGSRVIDPIGDVQRGSSSDAPQPPGIDLVTAELARVDGMLSFAATMADAAGEAKRLWVVRFRDKAGGLLSMLYAGADGVMMCDHDRFCSDHVEGATIEHSPVSVHVRLPLPKLPDRFDWEASASASTTANIDDTWNDFAPKATLSG